MSNEVREGDAIKVIGNHCWKGREGIVEQVEDVDGDYFVHASMNGAGEKIILRPGQYKMVKRGDGTHKRELLMDGALRPIRQIAVNTKYGLAMRIDTLKALRTEIDEHLKNLEGERDVKDHEQELGTLRG